MPVKRTQAKEAKTPYRPKRKAAVAKSSSEVMLRWAEIESATEPIVLERNGQPVAVIIKYADYRQMDAARAERREMAWRQLDALLAKVHARTQDFSSEEIEAEIIAARPQNPIITY